MQRCSVSIGDGDNPRISANSYFAVTSNSLQFGANVQAYASAAGFSIQGYLGFDVLIIFSPFSFEFDFTVSFSRLLRGRDAARAQRQRGFLRARPWNFNGAASISILFLTVSASLNLTWGDSTPVDHPAEAGASRISSNALQTPGNWSAALPAGNDPGRHSDDAQGRVGADPRLPDGHAQRSGERRRRSMCRSPATATPRRRTATSSRSATSDQQPAKRAPDAAGLLRPRPVQRFQRCRQARAPPASSFTTRA